MRIGTRGSALALAQARLVADLLDAASTGGPPAELVTIATAGDRDSAGGGHPQGTDPGAEPGGTGVQGGESARGDGATGGDAATGGDKSRWVLELERALSAGEIDLAVHSAKDVPGELAEGLALLGAPLRAASEDVLCRGARATARPAVSPAESSAEPTGLEQLPHGARVGTGSVRRAAQLRAARDDLEVVAVRGNVDTRLRKLDEGGFDALVLARAGLQRLGREAEAAAVLDPARFIPSPGQGTLALEARAHDERAREAVLAITDTTTFACLQAERAVAHTLGASCDTPLGALALDYGCGCLHLRAWVGLPDGSAWVADELLGGFYDPEQLGRRVAERLLLAGAGELLDDRGIAERRGARR
jgi:hydroxymethylbilane synthase